MVLCLALLLSGLLPGASAASDAFVLRGIEVSAEGADGEQARQSALRQGPLEAFGRLVSRLVIEEDMPGVPALAEADLEALIVSFEIERETPRRNGYSASLTYRFDPDAVRALFSGQGLRFTEARSRPLMVLAVLGEGADARLWEEPNPWRDAWSRYWGTEGLVPLQVPLGELQDVSAVDAAEALAGDARALAGLAASHGGGGALVAQALLEGDPEEGAGRVTVVGRFHGSSLSDPIRLQVGQEPGELAEDFWQRVVASVDRQVQQDWKRANAVYYGTQSSLPVTVLIAALQDWLLVRSILDEEPLVISLQVLGLSRQAASIVVTYRGSLEQLQRALEQHELTLQEGMDGWQIVVGAGAAQLDRKPLGTQ